MVMNLPRAHRVRRLRRRTRPAHPVCRSSRPPTLAAFALAVALGAATPASAAEYTINACQADRTNYSTQAFEDFATRGMIDRADQMVLVTTPDQLTATLAIHALDQLDRERTTVLVNRTHPRLAPELRAIEECLARRDAPQRVTLPDDRRLAMMLASGTYSLEALDRRTRLPVKRLGLAVAERLV
jgi:hypothetical protein